MNVYFAADFARANEAEALALRCVDEAGIAISSRWHRHAEPAEAAAASRIGGPPDPASALAAATRNLSDLDRSDVVVVLTTGETARGGRHFETGYAYATGKHVIVAGPIEHAFHHLPGIIQTTPEALSHRLIELNPQTPPSQSSPHSHDRL
jgi:nucleoside 2-deoxyribosyltransferase